MSFAKFFSQSSACRLAILNYANKANRGLSNCAAIARDYITTLVKYSLHT
jgi:hypothetical protein